MQSHADIIGKWPNTSAFAADLEIHPSHARTLIVRKSIPPDYWDRLVTAAKRRGIVGVSSELLLKLRPQRKPPSSKRAGTIPANLAQIKATQA